MIKETSQLLKKLEKKYPGLETPFKLRKYFSEDKRIFFDCDKDPDNCLQETLTTTPTSYRAYYIIQDTRSEKYTLTEALYSNYPETNIGKWITRYLEMLRPGGEAGLEASGKIYLEFIGAEPGI